MGGITSDQGAIAVFEPAVPAVSHADYKTARQAPQGLGEIHTQSAENILAAGHVSFTLLFVVAVVVVVVVSYWLCFARVFTVGVPATFEEATIILDDFKKKHWDNAFMSTRIASSKPERLMPLCEATGYSFTAIRKFLNTGVLVDRRNPSNVFEVPPNGNNQPPPSKRRRRGDSKVSFTPPHHC